MAPSEVLALALESPAFSRNAIAGVVQRSLTSAGNVSDFADFLILERIRTEAGKQGNSAERLLACARAWDPTRLREDQDYRFATVFLAQGSLDGTVHTSALGPLSREDGTDLMALMRTLKCGGRELSTLFGHVALGIKDVRAFDWVARARAHGRVRLPLLSAPKTNERLVELLTAPPEDEDDAENVVARLAASMASGLRVDVLAAGLRLLVSRGEVRPGEAIPPGVGVVVAVQHFVRAVEPEWRDVCAYHLLGRLNGKDRVAVCKGLPCEEEVRELDGLATRLYRLGRLRVVQSGSLGGAGRVEMRLDPEPDTDPNRTPRVGSGAVRGEARRVGCAVEAE